MELQARIKKLAQGVPARDAVRAHARSLLPGEVLTENEKLKAAEFEATVEAMFLMAAVDGDVSDEEEEMLSASVHAIADMHVVEGLRLGETLNRLNEKLARDGWSARLESVARRLRTEEGRAFAFRLAAGVAFVDDQVRHAEAAAIDAFGAALGLAQEESQSILADVHAELFGD